MTSQSATSSQQSNKSKPITSHILYQQCPHGLLEDFPVAVSTLSAKWNRGNVYNKSIAQSKWRSTWIYNVICQHPDCISTQTWCNRFNYRSLKMHWTRNHGTQNEMQFKVVSYWKTEKNGTNIKATQEYRLVATDTLDYINRAIATDDTHMHILDTDVGGVRNVAGITSIPNQDESANTLNTNAMDISTSDSDQDIPNNNNRNPRKRTLDEPSNPASKRQRSNGHDDMVLLPRTVLQKMTDMMREMKQVATDLRVVEKGLKDTKDHFDEMMIALEEQQTSKHCAHCVNNDDECQSLLKNAMDLNRRDIQSVNLQQFVANESQNVWSLEQIQDGSGDFLLQCKLCDSCTDILNDNKEETDDDAPNNEAIDKTKRRSFREGQIISSEQRINPQYFNKKYQMMKKHAKTNKKHLAILTVFNDNMNACSSNITVKSEVAFQLFTRSEPDILFQKIMTLLHR